jgi:hypothetical protein
MSKQFGVLSRAQALAAGLTRGGIEWRLKKEIWTSVFPGVYKSSCSPPGMKQRMMAAILWAGVGAVLSHRSGAQLWELEGNFEGPVEITLPSHKKPPPGIVGHRRKLVSSEQTHLGIFPITTVTRTLFDLASVVTLDQLLIARDDAIRRRRTTWARLEDQLSRGVKGQPGVQRFRQILKSDSRGESPLEREFMGIVRRFGLPTPIAQYEIGLAKGGSIFIDFAYPEARLAIEMHGFGTHGAQEARWENDLDRDNELTGLRWNIFHFSKKQLVGGPEKVARRIRAYLEECGCLSAIVSVNKQL